MFRKKRNSSSGMAKAKRELRERSNSAQNMDGSSKGVVTSVNHAGVSRSRRHSAMPKSSSSRSPSGRLNNNNNNKNHIITDDSPSAPPKERLFSGRKLASFSVSPNTRSFRMFKRTASGKKQTPEESFPEQQQQHGDDDVQKTPTKSSRSSRFSLRAAYFTAPVDRSNRKVNSTNTHHGAKTSASSGLSFMPDLVDEEKEQESYELDAGEKDLEVLETPKPKGRSKKRASRRRQPPPSAPDLSPYADSPSNRQSRKTFDTSNRSSSMRAPAPYSFSPPSTTKATRGTLNSSMFRSSSIRVPAPYSMTLDNTSMSPHSMRHSMRSEAPYTRPNSKVDLSTSMRSTSSTPGGNNNNNNNSKTRRVPNTRKSRRQQKLDDERETEEDELYYAIGQLVMLHSLQNDEMNGRKGRVYNKLPNNHSSDRYHIALFEPGAYISKETVPPLEEEEDYVAIRPKNLRLITWEEAAADNDYETADEEDDDDYAQVPTSTTTTTKKKKKKKKKKKMYEDERSVDTELTPTRKPRKKKKMKNKKKKKKKAQERSVAHHERSEAIYSADDDFTADDDDLTADNDDDDFTTDDDDFTADDNFTASGDDLTTDDDDFTTDDDDNLTADDDGFSDSSEPIRDSIHNKDKKVAQQQQQQNPRDNIKEAANHPTRYSGRSTNQHTATKTMVKPNKKTPPEIISVDDFVVGEQVQLHGLQTETMNGREGYVYGKSKDRIHVVIDQVGEVDVILKNFMQNKDYVAIRPQNLVHLGNNKKIYNHLDSKKHNNNADKNIRPPSDRGNGLYTVPSDSDWGESTEDEEIADDQVGTRHDNESKTSLLVDGDSDWGSSESEEAADDAMTEDDDDFIDDEASEMKSVDEDIFDEPAIKMDDTNTADDASLEEESSDDERFEEESIEEESLQDDDESSDDSSSDQMTSDKGSLDKASSDEESLSLGAIMETSEFNDTKKITPPTSYKKKNSFSKETDETSITVDDLEEEEEEIIIGLNDQEEYSDEGSIELELDDSKKDKMKENEKSQVLDWYHCSRMLEMESEEEDTDSNDSESEFEMQSTSDDDSSRPEPKKEHRKEKDAEASSLKRNHFSLQTAIENVKAAVQYEEMLRDLKKKGMSRELMCDDPEDDCSEMSMTDKSYIMDLSSQIIQRQALRQEELLEMAFDLFQHLASKAGGQFDGQSEELFLQIHQQVTEKHGPELKERDDAKDKQLRHYLAAVRHKKY